MKKYLTDKLFLEYNSNVILLNLINPISYKEYYCLNRIIFKSLFKFLYLYKTKETIFILRKTENKITHYIDDIDYQSFKYFLLNFNKKLFNEYKRVEFFKYNREIDQLTFLNNLYQDPRYQQISARQYNSYLNNKIRNIYKSRSIGIQSLDDIFSQFTRELAKKWICK